MRKTHSLGNSSWKRIGYCLFIIFFLLLTIGPLVWAFLISITPEHGMFSRDTRLFPEEITWSNYELLFSGTARKSKTLWMGLFNTIKAVGMTLAVGMPIALMSAYTLARMEFKGRILIRNLLMLTMVIPVMATIIPIYRIFAVNHLLNQIFWLSVVYVTAFLPMTTWLITNYFATIPRELEEAALVDGCGKMKCFFRIILPTSYPILFAAALMMVLSTWNQFQIPLILASSVETKPIAIVASEFVTKDTVAYGLTAAAGILAILPPAILAVIFRKFLVSGMTSGAVK